MAIFVALIDAEVIVERFVRDDLVLILVITDLKGSRVSEKVLNDMINKQASGFRSTRRQLVRGCKM